jgi:F-type H+-transporting ATPase subunit alpha
VDVGKSVSRVGGTTQLAAYRAVAGDLRLSYSQFEELEAFSRFGTRLDEETRKTLERGRRVREVLKQPRYEPLRVAEQIAVLVAVNGGVFDDLELKAVAKAQEEVRKRVSEELPELCERVERGEKLTDEDLNAILRVARGVTGAKEEEEDQDANDRGPEEEDPEHRGSPVGGEDDEGLGRRQHPAV